MKTFVADTDEIVIVMSQQEARYMLTMIRNPHDVSIIGLRGMLVVALEKLLMQLKMEGKVT